ncbi:MAG: NAD-dependent epimerase/dehydratase family protein [Pirellulales bacterium]
MKIECFQGRKILVVGGAGFVGSNLVRMLLPHDPKQVLVVDNLLSAERENVPQHTAVEFVDGSICDDRVLSLLPKDLDYVFHLATFHGNQNSIVDPLADHENNTLTTLKLFDRLKGQAGLKKVVYSSAGCTVAEKTYGDAQATTEDAPVSLYLDSPYQISKVIGEFYANFYWMRHKLPVVKARFQNVYGPGEILGAGAWRGTPATVWRNVTPTFVYKSIKHMPLPLENGGDASRDFIFVDDIAEGLMRCAAFGEAAGVYNLASGQETTIRQLAEAINRHTGNPTPVQLLPKRDWDRSGKRFGSTDKALEAIGFATRVAFEDGIRRTVAWTKENLPMIEGCMSRHHSRMAA